jgi:E3 ubiquitin-protein ligase RNF5
MGSDPVVTYCGHLFCWNCLALWLESGLPASNACPVCKSGIDKSKIIPIYVKGREEKDPRFVLLTQETSTKQTAGTKIAG